MEFRWNSTEFQSNFVIFHFVALFHDATANNTAHPVLLSGVKSIGQSDSDHRSPFKRPGICFPTGFDADFRGKSKFTARMNISEGRESRGIDNLDMAKLVTDFRRDALSATPATLDNMGLFTMHHNAGNASDRSSTAGPMYHGLPIVSATATPTVRAPGEATAAAAVLSKRPDSIMSTAKQIAKAIKPSSAAKNARLNEANKTNGFMRHVSGSTVVSAAVPSSLQVAKQTPVEIRPLQPAGSQQQPLHQSVPLAFFGLHAPTATAANTPMLFMQQPLDNGCRFQPTAALNIAPVQQQHSSTTTSTTGATTTTQASTLPRFTIPQPQRASSVMHSPTPVVKPPRLQGLAAKRKPAAAKATTPSAIKPELKPKPMSLLRPGPAILDLTGAGGGPKPKRTSNGDEAQAAPKKRPRKKPASVADSHAPPLMTPLAGAQAVRFLEGPYQTLQLQQQSLPGIAAMMPHHDRSAAADSSVGLPASGSFSAATADLVSSSTESDSVPSISIVTTVAPPLLPQVPHMPPLENGSLLKLSSASGSSNNKSPATLHLASPSRGGGGGQDSANENDSGTDLMCSESLGGALSPSPPVMMMHVKSTAVSGGLTSTASETENGAFRKKTRLIYDSGVRKINQINQETSGGGAGGAMEHHAAANGTDLRTTVGGACSVEKPVLGTCNTNRNSILNNTKSTPMPETKPVKKTRKPRSDKGISPRLPKSKKEKAVVTTTKVVAVKLELKRLDTEEQTVARMKRLAHKWPSIPENSLRWLVATKSVGLLKMIRWLRLVDRASMQAELAKNLEKVEILQDRKIQAIMELEKLQAPFEPRLLHFLHPQDQERKCRLLKKYYANHRLSVKETKWLREHYDRLRSAEDALPGFGASTERTFEKPIIVPITKTPAVVAAVLPCPTTACTSGVAVPHPGNERGNFQPDHVPPPCKFPSTSAGIAPPPVTAKYSAAVVRPEVVVPAAPSVSGISVQTVHQFVRKFPDSTRAVIEVDRDGVPCAVLLLIQQPNSKAVHIKKTLKRPALGFASMKDAYEAATTALDHLVMKFLCVPAFPLLVRYPITPGLVNDHLPPPPPISAAPSVPTGDRASVLSFNRHIHGWETIQYVDDADVGQSSHHHHHLEDVVNDHDFDLANDLLPVRQSGLLNSNAICLPENEVKSTCLQQFGTQIASRRPLDLTAVANDPVEQRRWLCWELRHLAQQYFALDAAHQAREAWYARFVDDLLKRSPLEDVPAGTVARALRCLELARTTLRKPKQTTALVHRIIRMGEQVRDVLESYKRERPVTRRRKAKLTGQLAK
ncbi:hypothetical protein BV898_07419 [Hypsibius exemplaris]|uniref:Uncharacterized protein n=1 Tax=Hypsibius exemplaris TaxID=2072580 RepID=A0A1W0WTR0_HYPEX|nr:hypothetical protein BV898_07419 [Hypsibius exemplaris]